MKNLSLTATIYIVLSLLFVIGNFTVVMANPGRIEEPGFETVANWTYSETDLDFTDGVRSVAWKKQGTYSYLFSSVDPDVIAKNAYCQILQSVDFDSIDRISFDTYLGADSNDYEARMLVGATQVWSKVVPVSDPVTPTEYLHEEVDLSGQSGIKDLIIQIYAVGNASNSDLLCYFDNIKIWGSHSDTAWTTVCNSFAGATNHVYMYGENFDDDGGTATKVGYYDGGNTLRQTDTTTAWGGGTLNWSECYFMDYIGVATAGTWHAVVLLQTGDLPAAYADAISDPDFVADDSFVVEASAIPEFPEVMAAIGVAGLCFGIYYWMRKRARRAHRVHGVT